MKSNMGIANPIARTTQPTAVPAFAPPETAEFEVEVTSAAPDDVELGGIAAVVGFAEFVGLVEMF
jgi:hypothetical protein